MTQSARSTPPGQQLTAPMEVDFSHWRFELTADELRKFGSPHFDKKSAGEALAAAFEHRGISVDSGFSEFTRDHITTANQAYPESAVVDPIADLELWEEWRLGNREFPYVGRYAPLGIFRQGIKTSSPSSVGIVGEILAGLFGESVIAPAVLVRVIRRWPDFIFYSGIDAGNHVFAFLEAKAVGPNSLSGRTVCNRRVLSPQFQELATNAVQQINSDPLTDVWGAFTFIRRIVPFSAAVTFVQIVPPPGRRHAPYSTEIPKTVLSGLAQRAVGAVVSELPDEAVTEMVRARDVETDRLYQEIVDGSVRQFDSIVAEEIPGAAASIPDERRNDEIAEAISQIRSTGPLPGKRFGEAKRATVAQRTPTLKAVGTAGDHYIFMADLPAENRSTLRSEWLPDWQNAAQSWDVQDGVTLWRAGGAVFTIGSNNLEGRQVRPRPSRTRNAVP
jgi:hypothetical protein